MRLGIEAKRIKSERSKNYTISPTRYSITISSSLSDLNKEKFVSDFFLFVNCHYKNKKVKNKIII